MRNCFTEFGRVLDDPLSGFGIIVELAFDISGRRCRDTNLIELGVYLYVLTRAGSKRSHDSKDRPTGFHALTVAAIAEHTGASHLAIERISMNRHMQIRPKLIGFDALLLHRLHMPDLYLNTATNESRTAGVSDLAALNSLGGIAVCVTIVSLIRRGQINFVGHL